MYKRKYRIESSKMAKIAKMRSEQNDNLKEKSFIFMRFFSIHYNFMDYEIDSIQYKLYSE